VRVGRVLVNISPSLPAGPNTEGIVDLLTLIGGRIKEGNTAGEFEFERSYTSGATESESRSFSIRWTAYA
jgi:hypothetical protein